MANRRAFKTRDDNLLLDQGDIIADVPLVKWKDGEPTHSPNRAVISSHGCVCEDYERAIDAGRSGAAARAHVQVVPLRPASVFRDKLDLIQAGQMLDYFFVEGDGQKLQHQVAILTLEQPVPASVLKDRTTIAQLADWQWEALRLHATIARFRVDPSALFRDDLLRGTAE